MNSWNVEKNIIFFQSKYPLLHITVTATGILFGWRGADTQDLRYSSLRQRRSTAARSGRCQDQVPELQSASCYCWHYAMNCRSIIFKVPRPMQDLQKRISKRRRPANHTSQRINRESSLLGCCESVADLEVGPKLCSV